MKFWVLTIFSINFKLRLILIFSNLKWIITFKNLNTAEIFDLESEYLLKPQIPSTPSLISSWIMFFQNFFCVSSFSPAGIQQRIPEIVLCYKG